MKHFTGIPRRGAIICSLILIALCGLATFPFLSQARPDGVTVSITNNSSRGLRNVFFSPVENDNWGDNQLTRAIAAGENVSVGIENCNGSQVKVIAEDTDGCFLTYVVSCGGNVELTITDSSARDCGN